jgi:hypothetical protein
MIVTASRSSVMTFSLIAKVRSVLPATGVPVGQVAAIAVTGADPASHPHLPDGDASQPAPTHLPSVFNTGSTVTILRPARYKVPRSSTS